MRRYEYVVITLVSGWSQPWRRGLSFTAPDADTALREAIGVAELWAVERVRDMSDPDDPRGYWFLYDDSHGEQDTLYAQGSIPPQVIV